MHSDEVRRLGQFALRIVNVMGDAFDYSGTAPFAMSSVEPDQYLEHWALIGYRVVVSEEGTPRPTAEGSSIRLWFVNLVGSVAEYVLEGLEVERVRLGDYANLEVLVHDICDLLWEGLESDPSGKYGVDSPYRVVLDS
jgi:hypothetical protein